MADYYCEISITYAKIPAGTYHIQEQPVNDWLSRRYIELANRVWKETDHGVFWIKNRGKGTIPEKLDDNELREFVWTKLSAHQTA